MSEADPLSDPAFKADVANLIERVRAERAPEDRLKLLHITPPPMSESTKAWLTLMQKEPRNGQR
jgi:hypothetical protein